MDIQTFWEIIGTYNQETPLLQTGIFIFLLSSIVLSYKKKINGLAKFTLGITNLFIGIVFFGIYGTEPIQKFFALPLYITSGILFLYESIRHKDDAMETFTCIQIIILILYLLYPVLSILLGNAFPQMVTYIMPCPIASLSIAVYSSYKKKNKLLLALLTIWGLTGVKSIIFHAYEDMILLLCGLYGVFLLYKECKPKPMVSQTDQCPH